MSDEKLIDALRRMSPRLDMLDCENVLTAADRIEAQAAEIERLRGDLAEAEWLLIDASVQLEDGRIKTRRNRASLIRHFLADLTGAKP